jgi:hypothetical protein
LNQGIGELNTAAHPSKLDGNRAQISYNFLAESPNRRIAESPNR